MPSRVIEVEVPWEFPDDDAVSRARKRAAEDLATFIEELIEFTARPGKTLTGNYAPYWPIWSGASSASFSVSVNTNLFGRSGIQARNRIESYPPRIESEQGALRKFFDQFEPLIESEFSRLFERNLQQELDGLVSEQARLIGLGRIAGRREGVQLTRGRSIARPRAVRRA